MFMFINGWYFLMIFCILLIIILYYIKIFVKFTNCFLNFWHLAPLLLASANVLSFTKELTPLLPKSEQQEMMGYCWIRLAISRHNILQLYTFFNLIKMLKQSFF